MQPKEKELEQLRLEIAKSYYVGNLNTTPPTGYKELALKSFNLAEVFVKVYEDIKKESPIQASAFVKGGDS